MHSKDFVHRDIKPENLLLGENFKLKICDFDLSYLKGDPIIQGKGTEHYRAPEVRDGCCKYPLAADIYSAGIILFILQAGYIPYLENKPVKGFDLYEILLERPERFWDSLDQVREKPQEFSADFRTLFLEMVRKDPTKRATLESIKGSEWYNKPIYNKDELTRLMNISLKQ